MRAMMISWRMDTLPSITQKVTRTVAAAYSPYMKLAMLTLITVSPCPLSYQAWRKPDTEDKWYHHAERRLDQDLECTTGPTRPLWGSWSRQLWCCSCWGRWVWRRCPGRPSRGRHWRAGWECSTSPGTTDCRTWRRRRTGGRWLSPILSRLGCADFSSNSMSESIYSFLKFLRFKVRCGWRFESKLKADQVRVSWHHRERYEKTKTSSRTRISLQTLTISEWNIIITDYWLVVGSSYYLDTKYLTFFW